MVDSIVATAISPQSSVSDVLNAKDAEDISSLYLEVKISLWTHFYVYAGLGKNSRLAWKGVTCWFMPLQIFKPYSIILDL